MAASPTTLSEVRPLPARRKPRYVRMALLVVLAMLLALAYPPFFQFSIKKLIALDAWRHGARFSVGKIRGSLFQPVVFENAELTSTPGTLIRCSVKIENARASFSVANLLFRRGAGWLRLLSLDGVRCETSLAAEGETPSLSGSHRALRQGSPWRWLIPETVDASRVDLAFRQRGRSICFENMRFLASASQAGPLLVRKVSVTGPSFQKTFSDIRGIIAVQDGALSVSDVKFAPTLQLDNASIDLGELAAGRLEMDFNGKGFGGAIRGELKSSVRDQQRFTFDGTGSFSQISISDLAAFVGSKESAGGVIHEGKFTFHGSPRNWEKATFSTRLEATEFRWGGRQWNALAVGATMSDRRIQIPDMQLRQAHNTLSLNGELALPANGTAWWQSEFSFNIAAKIDNLSELSSLFGPEFADSAGRLTVDGAIRGAKSSFDGQLIVTGAQLSYGTAPLDVLNAAIKIHGNELQISHLEFAHGADYLRGNGVVNILGQEKRYWGELRASVEDLALYSAFFVPPVAPRAFKGGLFVDWSGDGMSRAHSGSFRAKLKNLRPLTADDPAVIPLNADLEGTYSPQAIFLSNCVVGTGDNVLSARVTANPESLHLEGLRLQNKNATSLEGDALLPLNVWAAWLHPGASGMWNFAAPVKVELTAKALQLQNALLISGRRWPVKGEVNGTFTADGTLTAPTFTGDLQLKKSELLLPLEEPLSVTQATVSLHQQTASLKELTVLGSGGSALIVSGDIDLRNLRDPALKLLMAGTLLVPAPGWDLRADAALEVGGPLSGARVTGSAKLLGADLAGKLPLEFLLDPPAESGRAVRFAWRGVPTAKWAFDIAVTGKAPVKIDGTVGKADVSLRLAGPADSVAVTGLIHFGGLIASSPFAPLAIEDGTLFLTENTAPTLALKGFADMAGYRINAVSFGTFPFIQTVLDSTPLLSEQAIRSLLSKGFASDEPIEGRALPSLGMKHIPNIDALRPAAAFLQQTARDGDSNQTFNMP